MTARNSLFGKWDLVFIHASPPVSTGFLLCEQIYFIWLPWLVFSASWLWLRLDWATFIQRRTELHFAFTWWRLDALFHHLSGLKWAHEWFFLKRIKICLVSFSCLSLEKPFQTMVPGRTVEQNVPLSVTVQLANDANSTSINRLNIFYHSINN